MTCVTITGGEHTDAGTRRAHPSNPHSIRAEREDAAKGKLTL
jgi:hypothetical protein